MSDKKPETENSKRNDTASSSEQQGARGSSSNWVALAAAVIALCALTLAVYEGHRNRLHQRLSVRPYVKFSFYYNDAGAHYGLDNWGLGPAVLYWFRAYVDGKSQKTWRQLLTAIGVAEDVKFVQSIPATGVMMQPSSIGQPVKILSVEPGDGKETLIRDYQRITLEACYCSLYEECWFVSTDTSSPLSRESCEPAPEGTFGWER